MFYEFSLERHVPAEHLLRSIDRFVELDGVRRELAPFYSEAGRPSIDPELMIRMLIVGYCFGIRSERRLCEEVHLNLAYRWFCRLGLDGAAPDHSTFSKNRHGRFRESDLLRKVFETTVRRCIAEGLVGGEGFAVDASMIKADANRQRSVPGSEWQTPEAANHAVREYLAVLDDAAFGAATSVDGQEAGYLMPEPQGDPEYAFTGAIEDYPEDWLEAGPRGVMRLRSNRRRSALREITVDPGGAVGTTGRRAWFLPGKFGFCPACKDQPPGQAREINKLGRGVEFGDHLAGV